MWQPFSFLSFSEDVTVSLLLDTRLLLDSSEEFPTCGAVSSEIDRGIIIRSYAVWITFIAFFYLWRPIVKVLAWKEKKGNRFFHLFFTSTLIFCYCIYVISWIFNFFSNFFLSVSLIKERYLDIFMKKKIRWNPKYFCVCGYYRKSMPSPFFSPLSSSVVGILLAHHNNAVTDTWSKY